MHEILFGALLLGGCGYAILAGGRDGRTVGLALIAAALLSIPAGTLARWGHTQWPVLVVDLALLAALLAVAIRSRSYWPLWSAAFHALSVASHVATLSVPSLRPVVYFNLQAFWSLPCILVMVIGIMRDRKGWREQAA